MLALASSTCAYSAARVDEPNPPVWPSSVKVFGPGDSSSISSIVGAAYAQNGGHVPANHGQFSDSRYAFLFKPGVYDVDVPVGYYTQVLGLGRTPNDVVFASDRGVYSEEQDFGIGGALSSFWRSAENFRTSAAHDWQVGTGMMWAVSQAAPLRRVAINNSLLLFEYQPPITAAGEASGGFMANVKVAGAVAPGSQQQWFTRDSTVGAWKGGTWNMVFAGVDGAPASKCGRGGPFTTAAETPLVAEKPYLTVDALGRYALRIPAPKAASHGADFEGDGVSVGFERVYVARAGDSAATINAKLAAGRHIVFTPAIYHLDEPLLVGTAGQVLLGLGLATLVSSAQNTIIRVSDVDGVRVAGLILQAGPADSTGAVAPTLLEWGSGSHAGNAESPGVLSDVFARVGGPDGTAASPVGVRTMVHIRSGHVIGDNMWLWRADHAAGGAVTYGSNACDHGLVVDGDDVTMCTSSEVELETSRLGIIVVGGSEIELETPILSSALALTTSLFAPIPIMTDGLAVEHTEKDLTLWNGERGRTYFYQSELPYGVTQAQFGAPGYAGYRVGANVTTHSAWGAGVYSYFRDHNVTVASGIVAPTKLETSFIAPLTVFLDGHGGIEHVINDKGGASVSSDRVHYVC